MTDTIIKKPDSEATIGRRMVYVMSCVQRLVKDKQMQAGQKYKYVSHDQVVESVRSHMCDAGIVMQQRIVETYREIQKVKSFDKEVDQVFIEMKMDFDFCNCDDLEDKITVQSLGHGLDRGDKATGKAMSYCKKYAILQAFLIPTGDDPDHDQDSQFSGNKNNATAAKPAKTGKTSTGQKTHPRLTRTK